METVQPLFAGTTPQPSTLASLLGNRVAAKGGKKPTGIIITDAALIGAAVEYIKADEEFEKAKGALEALKLAFRPACRRAWFIANHGRTEPESSLKFQTPAGKLSVSFAAQWFPQGDVEAMGLPSGSTRRACALKIDVDKIPEAKAEAVVSEILAALAKHGVEDALEAKLVAYPKAEFALTRHTLTPDQNEAIELAGLGTRISFRR
jgi:hypothetical protein